MTKSEGSESKNPLQRSFFDRAFSLFQNNEQDSSGIVKNQDRSENGSEDKAVIPIHFPESDTPSNDVKETKRIVNISHANSSVAINSAFFDVLGYGSDLTIRLNEDHPLHTILDHAMSSPSEDVVSLEQQLEAAQTVIDLLLKGWSIYEDEEPIGVRKQRVQSAREDWGRCIRSLLYVEEEE